ncbi:hypothetical protein [Roseovarius sp. THAF8]|uniref:hypothetical protein n=1 Tax=Roseovarius sp. THAF8 TaxID=2587846 RepID=UPI0012693DB7|nr:hypothetical protein [Roseovarius sp. THAF8]
MTKRENLSESECLEKQIQELREKQKRAKQEERRRFKNQVRIAHEAIGECFHELMDSTSNNEQVAITIWRDAFKIIAQERYSKTSKKAKSRAEALVEVFGFQIAEDDRTNVDNDTPAQPEQDRSPFGFLGNRGNSHERSNVDNSGGEH